MRNNSMKTSATAVGMALGMPDKPSSSRFGSAGATRRVACRGEFHRSGRAVGSSLPPVLLSLFILAALAGCAHDLKQSARSNQDYRWHSPIIDALDVNHDGIIDSNEIANASAALWKLDKNHKGYLSYEDIHWPNQLEHEGDPEPVIAVLDANHDDIIDAAEIANAPAALKKLDKNGDGQLTPDEYTPQHPIGTATPVRSQDKGNGGNGQQRGPRSNRPIPPVPGQP